MEGSQRYIGIPNGIVLCVDQRNEQKLKGRFYHFYSEDAMEFVNMDELVFKMETFFNVLKFPYPANNQRVFDGRGHKGSPQQEKKGIQEVGHQQACGRPERRKIMNEEELLRRHGDIGTFIIRVQQRQNCSWQGRITWSDKNQTVNFRSIWEMIRLIEDALDTVSRQEDGMDKAEWAEEEKKRGEN